VKSEELSLNNAQKSIGTQLCGPQLCVLCVFLLIFCLSGGPGIQDMVQTKRELLTISLPFTD
jgi:hypothetical protein